MTKDTLQVGGRGSALLPTSCRALKGLLTLQSLIPGWGNAPTPGRMGDPRHPHRLWERKGRPGQEAIVYQTSLGDQKRAADVRKTNPVPSPVSGVDVKDASDTSSEMSGALIEM